MLKKSPENKLSWLQSQVIGGGCSSEFDSPFGKRIITYADTTATGRSLQFIEDFIQARVLPFYGNTHTGDSYVGRHSTKMVKESSQYIKKCLGGGAEEAILFCGSGATSAMKRLQEVMGIAVPSTLRSRVLQLLPDEEKWVVFVGPYEHHSNLLSWRQSLAEVVEIGLTDDGGSIDMEQLRTQLERYVRMNRPMLGSFSACSNVTGIVTDTRALARMLHMYGAFACFDFASSGPYVEINMRSGEIDGFDAVFVSPHKFIGGPGSPGILLMNKKLYLLNKSPPSTCGGGTVSYVNGLSEEDTIYPDNVEERENAGTPPITQTIRAALAFWIKEYIGYKAIEKQEHIYMTRAIETLGKNTNIQILGNIPNVNHIAILSFLVYPTRRHSTTSAKQNIKFDKIEFQKNKSHQQQVRDEKPLQGHFVAKLLNDLFGIQARGGCACAGPYGHYLLNIDKATTLAYRSAIQQGYEGVKPGWTRVSFPYYMSEKEFKFVLAAMEFLAIFGHRFQALYQLNWKTGEWMFNEMALIEALKGEHRNDFRGDELKLSSFAQEMKSRYNYKQLNYNKVSETQETSSTNKYESYMQTAIYMASLLPECPQQLCVPDELKDIDLPFKI